MLKPADIRQHWDAVKGPIADIMAGDGERPEDVYAECRFRRAFFYTCEHGFVLLKKYQREDTGAVEVLIWIAYGEGHDLIALYMPQLEQMARAEGAETLTLRTRRKGFSRALDKRWQIRAIEYELRIENGK